MVTLPAGRAHVPQYMHTRDTNSPSKVRLTRDWDCDCHALLTMYVDSSSWQSPTPIIGQGSNANNRMLCVLNRQCSNRKFKPKLTAHAPNLQSTPHGRPWGFAILRLAARTISLRDSRNMPPASEPPNPTNSTFHRRTSLPDLHRNRIPLSWANICPKYVPATSRPFFSRAARA